MRCPLAFFCAISIALYSTALPGQESSQARQLQAQLEELQQQLDQLRLREGANRNVTEIGTLRGRSRNDGEPRQVVRIYDLADLYSIAPSYPAREVSDLQDAARFVFPEGKAPSGGQAPTAMGGMGMGGMFSVPTSISKGDPFKETLHQSAGGGGSSASEAARTSVDNLIETITSTISPDEWADVGGPSSIRVLGASLIVSAPAHIHDKIAALIDLFRKRWRSLRTISVNAHWLWLTEQELESVPLVANVTSAAFGVLSDDSWKTLRELAAARSERTGYHAIVTCYNGQTVHSIAGGEQLLVTGMTPIVGGKEASPAYHPSTRMIQDGAALQITPIATRTAKYVVADVHTRVNLPLESADTLQPKRQRALAAGDVSQVVRAIDRPVLRSQRMSTTIRIPVDRPTLVGGMTFALAAADDPNLYLFLTTHVQELRDDEADEATSHDKAAGSADAKREQADSGKPPKAELP
jgi:hypothetical protein